MTMVLSMHNNKKKTWKKITEIEKKSEEMRFNGDKAYLN